MANWVLFFDAHSCCKWLDFLHSANSFSNRDFSHFCFLVDAYAVLVEHRPRQVPATQRDVLGGDERPPSAIHSGSQTRHETTPGALAI